MDNPRDTNRLTEAKCSSDKFLPMAIKHITHISTCTHIHLGHFSQTFVSVYKIEASKS